MNKIQNNIEIKDNLENPNLGSLLKSTKLGFRWSNPHKAFIRITDIGIPGQFRIEVYNWIDLAQLTEPAVCAINHFKWWEYQNLLSEIVSLNDVRAPIRPLIFIVNMDGFDVY